MKTLIPFLLIAMLGLTSGCVTRLPNIKAEEIHSTASVMGVFTKNTDAIGISVSDTTMKAANVVWRTSILGFTQTVTAKAYQQKRDGAPLTMAGASAFDRGAGCAPNSVATMAALKDLSVTGLAMGYVVQLSGYTSRGDGGGGQFMYDSRSVDADNDGTIVSPGNGIGRWLRIFTGAFNPMWFGAKIDGSDDTAAFAATITAAGPGGAIYIPKGTGNMKWSAKMTQLANQRWYSDGGQRSVTIEKAANMDMIDMGDLADISSLNFDCKGTIYTGRCIVIPVGFAQKINRVRIADSAGIAIHFNTNAGGGAQIQEIEGNTMSPLTTPVISVTNDTTAKPRFFSNLWLSGGMLDLSGCSDSFVSNCYLHHIVTSVTSGQVNVVNTRYASSGAAISIQGGNGNYTNCAFAGVVTFENSIGITASNCDFGFGFIEDPATCLFNSIYGQITAYTCVWNQASGLQPSIGDGKIDAWYQRAGRTCLVNIKVTFGTTTTFGNSSVPWRFSLPFTGHNAQALKGVAAYIRDASVPTDYVAWIDVGAAEPFLTLEQLGQGVRDGFPFAWANGDILEMCFTMITQ